MNLLDAAAKIARVEDDSVLEGAAVLVSYIEAGGKHRMQYVLLGDMTVAHTLGMFEIAKNDILHR